MLLHAFPSMFVRSLREFPENCAYKHDGLNCFIEHLHRNLLTIVSAKKVHLLDLHIKTINVLSYNNVFNSSQK